MEWDRLSNASRDFFEKSPVVRTDFVAIVISVLILGGVLWGAVTLARRFSPERSLTLARWGFLMVLLIPVNGMRLSLDIYSTTILAWLGYAGTIIVCSLVVVLAAVVLVRARERLIRVATTIVFVLIPFVPMTFFMAARSWVNFDATFVDFPNARLALKLPANDGQRPRVLWLVFDELDQRMTFLERPPTVELRELDRFRSEALHATHAYPPANKTLHSMPALLTDRLVSDAKPVGLDELMITYRDAASPVPFSRQPNVFSNARELGFNTAVVGWYLPYCRIIGHSLTRCSWEALSGYSREPILSESLKDQIEQLVNTVPVVSRYLDRFDLAEKVLPEGIRRYKTILQDATTVATDPELGLILVHWPVPHSPGIYDHISDEFRLTTKGSYLSNLELVDRALGALRREMEAAGTNETTTVLERIS